MTRRYDIEPLAAAMGLSLNAACVRLGVTGSRQKDYRTRGVTERVADRLATEAGFHPANIWPDWGQPLCDECASPFLPALKARRDVRFCSKRCNKRFHYRKRYAEEIGERERARARGYYAENSEYVRALKRRGYWADPEHQRERQRRQRRERALADAG